MLTTLIYLQCEIWTELNIHEYFICKLISLVDIKPLGDCPFSNNLIERNLLGEC